LFNRIHIVSFPLSFVDEPALPNERKRDPMLLDKLKEESPGILAWLVRGCLAWQEEGLNPPVSVKMATDEYREEQDWIQIFLDHCTDMDKKSEVQHGVLYACYRAWCGDNDIKPVGTIKFGRTVKKKVAWHDRDNKPVYLGIKLTPRDVNEGEQS
jgi:putative DNA primase/helicase